MIFSFMYCPCIWSTCTKKLCAYKQAVTVFTESFFTEFFYKKIKKPTNRTSEPVSIFGIANLRWWDLCSRDQDQNRNDQERIPQSFFLWSQETCRLRLSGSRVNSLKAEHYFKPNTFSKIVTIHWFLKIFQNFFFQFKDKTYFYYWKKFHE